MLQLLVVSFVYIVLLIILAPLLDHIFSPLEKTKDNYIIFSEVVGQILLVVLLWYYLNREIQLMLKYVHIKIRKQEEMSIDIISAIVLIGLQNNLMKKLNYLTDEHPVRPLRWLKYNL